jgi:hypothetical protein
MALKGEMVISFGKKPYAYNFLPRHRHPFHLCRGRRIE